MISDAGEMWLVEGLSDLDAQTRFNASCLLSIHFARLEECLHRYWRRRLTGDLTAL